MPIRIHPSQLQGTIQAPASKSSMQRACAAALLHRGVAYIYHPGHSNDDRAAMDIIQKLGAKLYPGPSELRIESQGVQPLDNRIHCGESGLSIRMFTSLAALSSQTLTIEGSGSLVTRPMDFFDQILPQLSVSVSSNEGRLPLQIRGPLLPVDLEVDGSLSSQFLTGLLMAYSAAFMETGVLLQDTTLRVRDLKSKPYIDLTLDVMSRFGMYLPENRVYQEFVFKAGQIPAAPERVEYEVEGDWSGAAFLLVAGAIAGPVRVRGLDLLSTQADRAIIEALMRAHAGIAMDAKQIDLHPAVLQGFEFDATDCPDLFPPLVALAAFCKGTTTVTGASRLTHKESNRAITLQQEFGKMGLSIELDGDRMIIHGSGRLNGAAVHSHHDHRIAMACATAALKADSPVSIDEFRAVEKSYPDFYDHLEQLGAKIDRPSLHFTYTDA